MIVFHLEANGGTNTGEYVKNICDATSKEGVDIHVFTSQNSIHGELELPVFQSYGLTSCKPLKLFWYALGWCGILACLSRKQGVKILHCHWFRFSPLDYIFLSLLRLFCTDLLLLQTVHNVLPHEEGIFDSLLYKKIYRKLHGVIFHSQQNVVDFETLFGPLKVQHFIVPHYGYAVKEEDASPKLNRSILFFGAIRPYKGLELLMEVLFRLGSKMNFQLTVAGKPEYPIEDLQRRVKESPLASKVSWKTGWIKDEEIDELFSSHSIVVLPYSRIDSSGVLHLAMSYGKIVVASNIGVFSDVIRHNENGILYPSESAEGLYAALHGVLSNLQGHVRLGRKARQHIIQHHSKESIGVKTRDVYRSLFKRFSTL